MRLLTIDPGARSGLALFQDGKLVYCTCLPLEKALALLATPQVSPDRLVIEIPRVYPSGRQPVPTNDLITLAVRAGRLIQAALVPTTTVAPSDWKKQVPDEILYARLQRELSTEERAVVARTKCASSYLHNALDAIGIGLVQLGRVGPGLVRKAQHAPESPGRAPEASHRPVPASTPTRVPRAACEVAAKEARRAARKVPDAQVQAAAPATPADAQGVPRGAARKPRKAAQHE